MTQRTLIVLLAAAALAIGCDRAARHRTLTVLFDGVPPLEPEPGVAEQGEGAPPPRVGFFGHGPYAAKMCSACHASAATNRFVAPRDQLCFHCHEMRLDKPYVHGPLASGGCTACHDPHSSRYRYLLVSESGDFCLYCHQRESVAAISAHAGVDQNCTTCHNPHASDSKYLLR